MYVCAYMYINICTFMIRINLSISMHSTHMITHTHLSGGHNSTELSFSVKLSIVIQQGTPMDWTSVSDSQTPRSKHCMKVPLRRVVMTSPAQTGPGIPGKAIAFHCCRLLWVADCGLNDHIMSLCQIMSR